MSRINPLNINLKELPPEGQEFTYSSSSGELNSRLKDLIQDNPYEAKIKITPMGNTFDLKGSLSSKMNLQCSLCAIDFKYPVELKLHELIMVGRDLTLGKNEQQTRANHAHEWETAGPDYILLESPSFDVGAYLHEMVALAEPIKPVGRPDCDENCENLQDKVKRSWLSYGEDKDKDGRTSPFQVLEKIKLKS